MVTLLFCSCLYQCLFFSLIRIFCDVLINRLSVTHSIVYGIIQISLLHSLVFHTPALILAF